MSEFINFATIMAFFLGVLLSGMVRAFVSSLKSRVSG